MPNFVDYHRALPLMSPQDVQDMVEKIRNGDPSQYGVESWKIYVGLDGVHIFRVLLDWICVIES